MLFNKGILYISSSVAPIPSLLYTVKNGVRRILIISIYPQDHLKLYTGRKKYCLDPEEREKLPLFHRWTNTWLAKETGTDKVCLQHPTSVNRAPKDSQPCRHTGCVLEALVCRCNPGYQSNLGLWSGLQIKKLLWKHMAGSKEKVIHRQSSRCRGCAGMGAEQTSVLADILIKAVDTLSTPTPLHCPP